MINLKEIKELINLVRNTEVVEIEVEQGGTKVRIKKSDSTAKHIHETVKHNSGEDITSKVKTTYASERETDGLVSINSPIVGSFYRAPSPDANPYVEIGDMVKKGQIVCIIEAMKLMNEIESDVDGKVVDVLIENGSSVEYGKPLFLIEPTNK